MALFPNPGDYLSPFHASQHPVYNQKGEPQKAHQLFSGKQQLKKNLVGFVILFSLHLGDRELTPLQPADNLFFMTIKLSLLCDVPVMSWLQAAEG